ncbi:hypothetical protein LAZ67_22000757 [Cordylochernes scorpioides]|uniref:Asparaginase n=1 Tax=Cordylochernes scorpioides TaxID=51811 RepID=A0ABY6LNK8_9ARAC|nr:hypothetical protein LAZ67_22000757 [Cordylochernes scorpioides]
MAHMEHLSGPIVIVHGGASTVPDSMVQAKLNGVKAAANRAFERLMSTGATAVDAVEAAVVSMENDPNFNAGSTFVLNSRGWTLSIYTYCRSKCVVLQTVRRDHDTVGAVAIDSQGKVASATSTGGITGKLPGRVGDTPLPGCGGYADNKVGAVSVTGHGEMIMRSILSARIITNLERGLQPKEALSQALQLTKSRTSGGAGAILVTADSKVAVDFSTSQMPWAYRTLTTLHYGIHPNDHHIEKI